MNTYIENTMDQLFKNSEQQQKEERKQLETDIKRFMEEQCVIETLDRIFNQYRRYKNGVKVQYKFQLLFEVFEDRLARLVHL